LANVAEAARPSVTQAAGSNFDYLLVPFREIIARKFASISGGEAERAAHWETLADWLAHNPDEVRAYRRLGVVLDRLRRHDAADPVAHLTEFLRTREYTLELDDLKLTIPFEVRAHPPETAVLTIRAGDRVYEFPIDERNKEVDAQNLRTVYPFKASGKRLVLRAGEPCTATLQLRNGQTFTWNDSRTRTFAFEALTRPPRMHEAGREPADGMRADGVVLRFESRPTFPAIPDLLPAVKNPRR
jgi:hypothetical protein